MPRILRSSWSLTSANSALERDPGRQPVERVRGHVLQPAEVLPVRVREVLVEHDAARVVGARHHPAAARRRGARGRRRGSAGGPRARRCPSAGRRATAPGGRSRGAGCPRAPGRPRGACPAAGRRPRSRGTRRRGGPARRSRPRRRPRTARPRGGAGPSSRRRRRRPCSSVVRTAPCVGQVVDERLAGERLVVDVRPAVPRGALPEALGGGVGVALRGVEARLASPATGPRPRPPG